jgi:predicted N-acyltransferase
VAEGEVGSFNKSHIAGRSSTTYTWHYAFTANGRRWHGSWSDTVPYGPKPGDRVVISYLNTNPAINHHGSTGNQEIDGSDIELIVCALFLLGAAIYLVMQP